MTLRHLRLLEPEAVPERRGVDAVPEEVLTASREIVENVRAEGEPALREYCERFDELADGDRLFVDKDELERELAALPASDRAVLDRIAGRIEAFAGLQLESLAPASMPIPGGAAGSRLAPVERAGCYAPGGLYPLPSSVLMTALTARAAGVREVWVASPRPGSLTLAAAGLAGAAGVVAAGGAHAVAALAFGTGRSRGCDLIAGPGNVWVTAAKKLLAGEVAIDMLAGPSEVLILADDTAPPALMAADLLAQAEHADDAAVILVCLSHELAAAVDGELARQLADLATREVAARSLAHARAVVCETLDAAIGVANRWSAEHLQVMTADPEAVAARLESYGSLFLGAATPTALGDYGAGPNHVLPTAGTARSTGGLSVLSFLRPQTWLRIDDRQAAAELYRDTAWLARREGLEAHARSADARRTL